RMSTAIQASLKRNVHSSVFSSPEAYTGAVSSAQTILAYCAIVPRAPNVTGGSDFPFWDFADVNEVRGMFSKPQTLTKMQELLTRAQEVLQDDSDADFFEPQDAAKILNKIDPSDPVLRGLLFAEAEVVKHSFEGGLKVASSRNATPSDAVKALATFGSK